MPDALTRRWLEDSSLKPDVRTPEALKRVARGREAIPRETAEKITNPERVAAGSGNLRTAFGVRALQRATTPGRRIRANPGLPAATPPA
jgi:hypothetical protein